MQVWNNRVLALMPHPDDMEILCGGTLIRLADAGVEVHVATMTAGDMGSAEMGRAEIAAIRRAEAAAGAQAVGATSYTCLGFGDVDFVFDADARRRVSAMLRKVDAVTSSDIKSIASSLLSAEPTLAVIGPFEDATSFEI